VLHELLVRDLGVIHEVALVIGPGMTALTGETGAGKTLLVEAVELILGGRADPALVRPGSTEASVEGRFDGPDGTEVVVRRVLPASGRSRAYIDGRLATAGELQALGAELVDLHGQHTHQSLFAVASQRGALDAFGHVDLVPLERLRAEQAELERRRNDLGGDERARAREIELLRYQVDEIDRVAIAGPDEDSALSDEEDLLAEAVAHQAAAQAALAALDDDGGARGRLAEAAAELAERSPFATTHDRLVAVGAEMDDLVMGVRDVAERIEPDPERLDGIRRRRHDLADLRRKYGETLAEVLSYRSQVGEQLGALEEHDQRAAAIDRDLERVAAERRSAEQAVGSARRDAAPALATAVSDHLGELAMARAQVEVVVGEDPGDDVEFLLAANAGAPALSLRKVASGGELARAMLALRLVLTSGPATLVFDEVDAGVGGTAATAVGRALARLGTDHQVLVVTHLPQVAACADAQVSIVKHDDGVTTRAEATVVEGEDRVVELTRMLAGRPDSETGREHARELLGTARATRVR
jgi:DNA repair protein RecN (Recombination protein N)